ncbi:unnamed protein product, partial [Ixodes pacificus]
MRGVRGASTPQASEADPSRPELPGGARATFGGAMLNAISRLRPGSPSSSGQSSPEPAPAPTGRHKQLIRRVLQTGPLRGSKKAAQTQHKDSVSAGGHCCPPFPTFFKGNA